MEDVIKRVKEICEAEGLNREELAARTGMTYSRWHNLMNGRGTIKSGEIKATGLAFKEYAYWLAYGEEMPEAGQVSPMTKAAQSELGTQRKA
jgi:transcriptional regulator with XRE-family HTH domain